MTDIYSLSLITGVFTSKNENINAIDLGQKATLGQKPRCANANGHATRLAVGHAKSD
ncbi:MAG: hypothetical protein F6K37_27360 [Moorea sp. SIO4E2]|uniref:hypothetical protein n=1 Tax=Moorena sp. SIO4E2 TaxID=2607826 RepID=UPI0013B67CE7|nr:hypothetical protein [Moorena sp. SIO4E2]NEQ09531.1 hypothetical protein [Moorena sp. SIO4E2]